jgi:hypothetical protein
MDKVDQKVYAPVGTVATIQLIKRHGYLYERVFLETTIIISTRQDNIS